MRRTILSVAIAGHVMLFATLEVRAQSSERTYFHPKMQAKEVNLRRLVVLPPAVQVSKQGVKGHEALGEESERATSDFSMEVTAALTDKGASVATPFTEEMLKDNDELRTALGDVQRQFDEIAAKLFNKEKDVKKGRFSVGDSVALLNTKGDADAFVIVRAAGNEQTKSKAFLTGGLLGVALSGDKIFYHSRVALVDAKSGDVLFLGDYISKGVPGKKLLEKSFQKIPIGS